LTDPPYAAVREVWAKYLDAAEMCGVTHDADFVSRITGSDDAGFRSALHEGMTAFFLDNVLGLKVKARPDPSSGKNVDLAADHDGTTIYVEVKAPRVPIVYNLGPNRAQWAGDDHRQIVRCIEEAGRQFRRGRANLLVVAPQLRTPVHLNPRQLCKAVLGEDVLVVPIALEHGAEAPPPRSGFLQNGKLARLHRAPEGSVVPHLTRVSAVMTVEEVHRDTDDAMAIRHAAYVAHNPFAEVPIDPAVFRDLPQWLRDGDELRFTGA
jgi:hypothetical protein